MAFESIQSSLSPYEDFKNFKSQDEFEMFQKLQSLKNNYWSPIPHKLLYNHSIDQQAKILWAILQHLGDAEGKSYYSQKKLAYFYGCSTKTISRHQQILVTNDFLEKTPGQGHPSEDCSVKWPFGCQNPKLISAINKSRNKR